MKEGGTMKEIIISIVSMQIGAFIGIATMCFSKSIKVIVALKSNKYKYRLYTNLMMIMSRGDENI